MGCFLACFGFHKRSRNRHPPSDRLATPNQIHLSYEPLVSSRITTCDTNDKLEIHNSKPRERSKEDQAWVKMKKKVSFNLNVQTYEPIPDDDHYFLDNDEEVRIEEHHQHVTSITHSSSFRDKAFTTSNPGHYPRNHRYQNCVDIYDDDDDDEEEDGFSYGESDLEDSEDHDELETSSVQLHSVLKPVENLTQWRVAKAKATTNLSLTRSQPLKSRSNSSLLDTRMQENMVHSSLSDWLSWNNEEKEAKT